MDTKTITKVIDGHTYAVRLHPAEEGWPLAAEILALGARPLVRVIEAWAKTSDDLTAGLDPVQIFRSLDWGQLGQDASDLAMTLASSPALVAKVLAHTTRDDKALASSLAFDDAYRGNYAELAKALVEVVKANGFVPFSF